MDELNLCCCFFVILPIVGFSAKVLGETPLEWDIFVTKTDYFSKNIHSDSSVKNKMPLPVHRYHFEYYTINKYPVYFFHHIQPVLKTWGRKHLVLIVQTSNGEASVMRLDVRVPPKPIGAINFLPHKMDCFSRISIHQLKMNAAAWAFLMLTLQIKEDIYLCYVCCQKW